MKIDRLIYVEADPEYNDQEDVDHLIAPLKEIVSGDMWSILEVPDNMDIDDIIDELKSLTISGTEPEPLYMSGSVTDSEIAERIDNRIAPGRCRLVACSL
jgi:hypothetical protein